MYTQENVQTDKGHNANENVQTDKGHNVNLQLLENRIGGRAKITFKGCSKSERGEITKVNDQFYVDRVLIDTNKLQSVQTLGNY